MFAVLVFSRAEEIRGLAIALYVGALFTVLSLFFSSFSPVLINPLRWFALTILSPSLQGSLIHWLAPFLGSVLGFLMCRLLSDDGCCKINDESILANLNHE